MSPEQWGIYGWTFSHAVALGYPINPTEEDKLRYYTFFNSYRYVLPCGKCRINYADHLNKYPLTDEVLSSRENLVKWTIDIHNVVNYYTGKKMLTYPEAIEAIEKTLTPKKKSSYNWFFIILIIIGIIVIIYLMYIVFKKKLNK
ncbi:putative FAD-linked sulfhydryl oxidase [Acanthamoeba castellanii mimivirus]|uniref:Probable FAD-linked sulfhydryl oxidase R368 n=5 Tax=Mimivirus TaxID=315393 RepID=YR368_MIMIV|nr:probable FAD-linked sulfhydryl oxidase [Acanthamoeba polyphaga mimivirus]Q5UQV6.1 RecName: Full=Probable FAD-linked sulfhydryl oxidase R368 [Acanthamoeba polyphaga mimivirus]AEQ60557.1 Erv1 / Alr family protein [Acanthamoeba castellanii mamavirus]AHA45495.1 putative FAD-linked sulfhydryl oxidase [Hirudovirus strain Sangsue]AHJ40076.1 FAD-linked sulfhydryl oxidase [Samba virus]ALR83948.1 Erv1 / Alr family protein [Niemeyer virus]AMZ02813.1 putative FAD-linked sulfhydryl oxidase [Mimivirus B